MYLTLALVMQCAHPSETHRLKSQTKSHCSSYIITIKMISCNVLSLAQVNAHTVSQDELVL